MLMKMVALKWGWILFHVGNWNTLLQSMPGCLKEKKVKAWSCPSIYKQTPLFFIISFLFLTCSIKIPIKINAFYWQSLFKSHWWLVKNYWATPTTLLVSLKHFKKLTFNTNTIAWNSLYKLDGICLVHSAHT